MPINPLDGLIVLGLLIGTGIGFVKGLVRQLVSIACLYIATVMAVKFFWWLSAWLSYLFNFPLRFADTLAFMIIAFVVYGVLGWLARDAYKLGEAHVSGLLDRLGGLALGFVLSLIWIGIGLALLSYVISVPWLRGDTVRRAIAENVNSSYLAPIVNQFTSDVLITIRPWLPRGLPEILNPTT